MKNAGHRTACRERIFLQGVLGEFKAGTPVLKERDQLGLVRTHEEHTVVVHSCVRAFKDAMRRGWRSIPLWRRRTPFMDGSINTRHPGRWIAQALGYTTFNGASKAGRAKSLQFGNLSTKLAPRHGHVSNSDPCSSAGHAGVGAAVSPSAPPLHLGPLTLRGVDRIGMRDQDAAVMDLALSLIHI